ncbi:glycosyltransferase family 2 protein [Anaerostipes sp.]|uniref:glycosyltransferase family 2 protein n=1 Tax=Anaerostipes sp. TaxID=1872530 RepID=UPI0025BF327D|nr:glycosyltransferase family 2 protein [Anaerostipes sp.]MBS7008940.1 glycosyltransferase family 2 protein [Anaerostipes sp.]
MKSSVVIAYYNGKEYIKEQADSILRQLGSEDELIISVDSDQDGSGDLLKELAENDERVQVIKGPGLGVVKNFQNGLFRCTGDVVFLADQDDVWVPEKIEKVTACFEDPSVTVVVHNAQISDENLKSLNETTFQWRDSGPGFWKNIKKNSYIGCCMAFRRDMLKRLLPVPDSIWIHDQWIGLLAEQLGRAVFLDDILLLYRRHGGNVTELTHGSVISMMKKRYAMIIEVNRRIRRWKREDAKTK